MSNLLADNISAAQYAVQGQNFESINILYVLLFVVHEGQPPNINVNTDTASTEQNVQPIC